MRANFDLAQPGLICWLVLKSELGVIGSAAGLAYGLSKFVMAGMSDRSNPVYSYRLVYCFWFMYDLNGSIPWATSGIAIMWVMIFLNGWFKVWVGSMWSYYGALGLNLNVVLSCQFGIRRII